eukprot:TRINITY_DN4526_c0_g1_i18.p3 TRINITY_DN4526_c0_g1~~TRINITY_DN4526_c0_g1_i18.p3  ORF type:complete len:115 (-),score=14.17 TRINITY_DN4526_c0_g1_i18:245-589(-)
MDGTFIPPQFWPHYLFRCYDAFVHSRRKLCQCWTSYPDLFLPRGLRYWIIPFAMEDRRFLQFFRGNNKNQETDDNKDKEETREASSTENPFSAVDQDQKANNGVHSIEKKSNRT